MAGRILGFLALTALLASSVSEAQTPSIIVGKVRDKVTHKPLPGCYVRLTKPELANGLLVLRNSPLSSTATDANGLFVFRNSVPGSYWLEIGDASHLPVYEHIAPSGAKDTLSFLLERDGSSSLAPPRPTAPRPPAPPPPAPKVAGRVLFRVTDETGKAIPGATISFWQDTGKRVGVSDSLGQVVFTNVWVGKVLTTVRATGYSDYSAGCQYNEVASESIQVRLAVPKPAVVIPEYRKGLYR